MLATAVISGPLGAAPYLPADDGEVLEQLRQRPLDPSVQALRKLRAELARAPQNLTLAVGVSRRYIEEARSQGDPRYLGYAQAALQPWWSLPQPPAAVLILRATIRQANHEFNAALDDLERVILNAPAHAQAWLTRATILQVQGRYEEAAKSCQALAPLAPEYIAVACAASVASMTGRAQWAYDHLHQVVQRSSTDAPEIKSWLETLLGEIALRLDRREVAEAHFVRALRAGRADPYLKATYADFLLESGRPEAAARLLAGEGRVDSLLLRLALADQALGAAGLAAKAASLQARFDAARARGDRVHLREEARFYTSLLKQPVIGLKLAQANWEVQKEPADARVLIEAALAADQRAAAQPVLEWMRQNRVEDAALTRLLRRFSD